MRIGYWGIERRKPAVRDRTARSIVKAVVDEADDPMPDDRIDWLWLLDVQLTAKPMRSSGLPFALPDSVAAQANGL
jgi:hypothetical protein